LRNGHVDLGKGHVDLQKEHRDFEQWLGQVAKIFWEQLAFEGITSHKPLAKLH
jgi:hypothetical protein